MLQEKHLRAKYSGMLTLSELRKQVNRLTVQKERVWLVATKFIVRCDISSWNFGHCSSPVPAPLFSSSTPFPHSCGLVVAVPSEGIRGFGSVQNCAPSLPSALTATYTEV